MSLDLLRTELGWDQGSWHVLTAIWPVHLHCTALSTCFSGWGPSSWEINLLGSFSLLTLCSLHHTWTAYSFDLCCVCDYLDLIIYVWFFKMNSNNSNKKILIMVMLSCLFQWCLKLSLKTWTFKSFWQQMAVESLQSFFNVRQRRLSLMIQWRCAWFPLAGTWQMYKNK